MTCDVTMWTQNDLKSQKVVYLSQLFLHRTETLYCCYTHHKVLGYVHHDISMATQWAPGLLHSKGKIRVFFLQEVLLILLIVHSVGVSKYGHYTAQAQGSLLNAAATNNFHFRR